MNRIYLLLTAAVLACFSETQAQQHIIVHANTTQHPKTPGKVKQPRIPLACLGSGESAIKVNITSILRSDYCMSYEKKLNRSFSAELTAGFTRYETFTEIFDFFSYRPKDMVRTQRQYRMAPSLKLGARYYFETGPDEISGPYLNVEAMYRSYGYSAKNNFSSPSLVRELSNQKEIRLLYGWQNSDYQDVAFYDCSIGVGYRIHDRSYLGYGNIYDQSSQQMLRSGKNYFVFIMSVKLGFIVR